MANLRDDYWSIGSLSLHTWAHHLTVTPTRTVVGRKGTNPVPLGGDGEDHRDKPWQAVTFLLGGWVSDRAANGSIAGSAALRIAQLEANLDELEAAFRGAGGQVTLTKRRWEDSGGAVVVPYTRQVELHTFDAAYGEVLDRRQSATARWTAEVRAADPWWYTDPGGVADHLS